MNRSEDKPKRKENPVTTANIFSKLCFWWLKDIFKIGMKRPIKEEEIYLPKNELISSTIIDTYVKYWDIELQSKSPSVLRLLVNLHGKTLFFLGLSYSLLESVMRVLHPLCLGGLVSYFASGQIHLTKKDAYIYASGIIVSCGISIISYHPFILYIFEMGSKIRIGCTGLIYRKTLRLSKSSVYDGLNGKVINIISNDLARFELVVAFFHDIWKGPMEAILFFYFLYREIGFGAIVGIVFLFSFIPIQILVAKKSAKLRTKAAQRGDLRVKIMNEIILGIQVIKMYTWEKSFADIVDKIRKHEISAIRGSAYIRAMLTSFGMISRLSIFLSLISYIYFGNIITAKKVFIVSSFFNLLNSSLIYYWPLALTTVAEGYITVKRLQEFLLASEDKPTTTTYGSTNLETNLTKVNRKNNIINDKCKNKYKIKQYKKVQVKVTIKNETKQSDNILFSRRHINNDALLKTIRMDNASAAWEINDNHNAGISSIDLVIKEGDLCVIVGQVGSGKSTLLNVIIGELELDSGSIHTNGHISYAAQEAWLFEGSIRNNIIFTEEFDEKRYRDVVRVCALERDFKLLPNSDNTIVGERGICLSGGQKARVNLARAVYKKADLYLLDDPLSAVDTHVGKHIFEECMEKYLSDKICVLVTHQLQYLKDVKHIVLMNQGEIDVQGSYKELQEMSNEFLLSMQTLEDNEHSEPLEKKKIERQKSRSASIVEGIDKNLHDREEKQAVGAVSLNVYKSYFKAVNCTFYIVFIMIMFVISQFVLSTVDYFVAQWANWEDRLVVSPFYINSTATTINSTIVNIEADLLNTSEREKFVIAYSVLMCIAAYVFAHRSFAFYKMCLRVSINLHDQLFRGITRATIYFYNTNPSGRILNRFSKDIHSIDSMLPPALIDCLNFFLEFLAIMILVAIVNYWLLIPTVVMTVLLYGIRYIYINTGRSLKRIESLTRSPVYSQINATLQGLSTVRVFKAQEILEKEFHEYLDINTGAWYLVITTNRAFGIWLDLVCLSYIACVTLSFLVFEGEKSSGNVGLAILQCIHMVGMCQWGIRQTAEVEKHMTSVERVLEYTQLPSEPPLESNTRNKSPADWPDSGNITFNNLNFKYSENDCYVLKNVNIQINAQEKVGIVGRTGAGKSSLIHALFRLANLNGTIIIDNIDINQLGLHDLRSKISIIPQDPVLFSGTIRYNLDPFDQKKDEDIWNALWQVELKSVVSVLPGGLNYKISDGGANFSMGQRQLICLARAILQKNKILILDEATANVDHETDKLIQTTIRLIFYDCTVLTIAHRLHTVMDCDRILVLDAGYAVEFGHPYELLQTTNGYLKKLIDETGPVAAEKLQQIAKETYNFSNPKDQTTFRQRKIY